MSTRFGRIFTNRKLPKRPAIKREKMLIIYAITLIFILSIGGRLIAGQYGFYLNEFDCYYHYHVTEYIVKSVDQQGFAGLFNYFNYTDKMMWYPEGRNVPATSFGGLYYIGALSYITIRNVFNLNISLYDYLVLLPVIVGAFISIAVYFLGKKLDGETTGIFAGLITAVSPALISRDSFGWFKSEPMPFLFGIVSLLLFISVVQEDRLKYGSIVKASLAGILLGVSMTIWGGSMYFVGVIGIVVFVSLFYVKSYSALFENTTVLLVLNLLTSMMFPKPGYSVFINPANVVIYGGLLSCLILIIRQKSSRTITNWYKAFSILLSSLAGLALLAFGLVGGLSLRYLTVLDPYGISTEAIVESVAEHQSPTFAENFAYFSIPLFFVGFGIYYILKKNDFMKTSALVFGAAALYFASSFGRLMIYTSFSLAILGGVGISVIIRSFFIQPAQFSIKKRGSNGTSNTSFKLIIATLFLIVMVWSGSIWIAYSNAPVSLATGSVSTKQTTTDWPDALTYIRESTPQDSVIISWWDYGYWITVMGNRTTLTDNATINSTKIGLVGKMFLSNESEAVNIIHDLVPNRKNIYVLVYAVAYQQLQSGIYLIGGGGEESKYPWMAKIGGLNDTIYTDSTTGAPSDYFWSNTTLGKMYPFTPTQVQYGSTGQIITAYQYGQKITSADPYFELAYSSSFSSYANVLLYKLKA